MADKLEIIVDSYEQRLSDEHRADVPTRPYSRGDLIEPRSDAERERLVSKGIAAEPGQAQREEADRLRAEAERLAQEAEAAEQRAEAAASQADAAAEGKDDLDGLTSDQLDEVAEAEGVDVSGLRKAEKLDAIRSHRAAQG